MIKSKAKRKVKKNQDRVQRKEKDTHRFITQYQIHLVVR